MLQHFKFCVCRNFTNAKRYKPTSKYTDTLILLIMTKLKLVEEFKILQKNSNIKGKRKEVLGTVHLMDCVSCFLVAFSSQCFHFERRARQSTVPNSKPLSLTCRIQPHGPPCLPLPPDITNVLYHRTYARSRWQPLAPFVPSPAIHCSSSFPLLSSSFHCLTQCSFIHLNLSCSVQNICLRSYNSETTNSNGLPMDI